jgi:very-short-patch-repair endonuclease
VRELFQLLERHRGLARLPATGLLANQAWKAAKEGLISRPLPRIAMTASRSKDPDSLISAVRLWRPTAIIAGRAAVRLQGMRSLETPEIDVLLPYSFPDRGPFRFHRSSLPSALITDWMRGPTMGLGAASLFLGEQEDWWPICEMIRQGMTTLKEIQAARRLLCHQYRQDSLDLTARLTSAGPWSVAEMKFHELLRHAGITGWAANRELVVRDGLGREWVFFIDVAFEEERLAVEVNSRQFHDNPRAFLRDAEKARILTAAGWKLVPIVPSQVERSPEAVLADLSCRLHRDHRPDRIPPAHYQPEAPFWW